MPDHPTDRGPVRAPLGLVAGRGDALGRGAIRAHAPPRPCAPAPGGQPSTPGGSLAWALSRTRAPESPAAGTLRPPPPTCRPACPRPHARLRPKAGPGRPALPRGAPTATAAWRPPRPRAGAGPPRGPSRPACGPRVTWHRGTSPPSAPPRHTGSGLGGRLIGMQITRVMRNVSYIDPQGLIRRTEAIWTAFTLLQVIAYIKWEEQFYWLVLIAGVRLTELFSDWTYLYLAQKPSGLHVLGYL
jgi:hypothetical protein